MQFSQFSDIELVFFYLYKKSTYLPSSQDLLLSEIELRGLNERKMLIIRDEVENGIIRKNCCPRCKSAINYLIAVPKVHYNDVIGEIIGDESGMKYHKICSVCGWDYRHSYKLYLFIKKIKRLFSPMRVATK